MSPIDSIRGASPLAGVSGPGALTGAKAASGTNFADLVKMALEQTSKAQNDSTALQKRFSMEDPTVSLEETMVSMQKASVGFQAVVQARNKLVSAYTEIMNMTV
ncbi:MAG: flagellar hook-basal body complex protein FliE [Betaproteobacteria bacterium]|nr:flagellar hook-basal body complex protein FliE [Betaproteobacteria bacterium]